MSMFQTLFAGNTEHVVPGTADGDGPGCGAAATGFDEASISPAISAIDRPRIVVGISA